MNKKISRRIGILFLETFILFNGFILKRPNSSLAQNTTVVIIAESILVLGTLFFLTALPFKK